MEITPKQTLWLSFLSVAAGRYTFDLRLCRYIEVENFAQVELGAEVMGVEEEEFYSFKDAVWDIPQILEEGVFIPKSDLSGPWEVPERLKCDLVTGATVIDPVTYAAESGFAWEFPKFWRSGEWAVFVPEKVQYATYDYTLDSSDTYWDISWVRWWGLGFFAGCDLNEFHILSTFTRSFPNDLNPYSDNPSSPSQIYLCLSSWQGFSRYYFSSGSLSQWYTKRYLAPTKDIQYYPPRYVPFIGCCPALIIAGISLLGLVGGEGLGLLPGGPIERVFRKLK
jgi:hypothetical protein